MEKKKRIARKQHLIASRQARRQAYLGKIEHIPGSIHYVTESRHPSHGVKKHLHCACNTSRFQTPPPQKKINKIITVTLNHDTFTSSGGLADTKKGQE